jgi:hypothetical protein
VLCKLDFETVHNTSHPMGSARPLIAYVDGDLPTQGQLVSHTGTPLLQPIVGYLHNRGRKGSYREISISVMGWQPTCGFLDREPGGHEPMNSESCHVGMLQILEIAAFTPYHQVTDP